jgi:hypothetical protein
MVARENKKIDIKDACYSAGFVQKKLLKSPHMHYFTSSDIINAKNSLLFLFILILNSQIFISPLLLEIDR